MSKAVVLLPCADSPLLRMGRRTVSEVVPDDYFKEKRLLMSAYSEQNVDATRIFFVLVSS